MSDEFGKDYSGSMPSGFQGNTGAGGSFSSQLMNFSAHISGLAQEVFAGTVAELTNSIVYGSTITGAPGQVVQDSGPGVIAGNLLASWLGGMEGGTPGFNSPVWESPNVAVIGTFCPYAESNEDGIARPGGGPYMQRSAIGGRWSVAHTRAGFQAVVDKVTKDLAA